MRKSFILGAAAAASLAGVAVLPGTAGATQSYTHSAQLHGRGGASGSSESGKLTPRYTTLPYHGTRLRSGTTTAGLPLFSHTVTLGSRTFTYRQVGKDPFVKQSLPATTVPVKVIPVKIVMQDFGKTFDPSSANCSPGGSPAALMTKSPLEQTRTYSPGGTTVGTDQYIGYDRRAEYFTQVKPGGLNPGYHLSLAFTQTGGWVITVSGEGSVAGSGCGSVAALPINDWDNLVRNTIIPKTTGVTPATFPLLLVTNVVFSDTGFFDGSCCVLGYHSAFTRTTGKQTYGVGEFDTSKEFSGVRDISALSHEIAEWADDPLVNNATPKWGHIGQVSGCQANLENGDPLSGTTVPITMNGFTYHPQELAFSPWFYRGSTNTGVNNWFSSNGKFRTAAAPCS